MAYTVQSGDNLSKIARQYGMDVRDLIASNPQLANPNLIRPGQRINIPDEPVSPAARAAAGNVLAAAPSVAQVVRTAAGTAPAIGQLLGNGVLHRNLDGATATGGAERGGGFCGAEFA